VMGSVELRVDGEEVGTEAGNSVGVIESSNIAHLVD